MGGIPYGRQEILQPDIDAVVDVLRSDFLTQGPVVPAFEAKVAAYCGASHASAMNSATSALHVACLALGLKPGDWLWTTPVTFVASSNCALHCGAKVDFVDVDPRTYNLSPDALERKLRTANAAGCLPKIVVPVHLAGQPCDMEAIYRLAREYGFHVIEDASHAIGGRYQGEPIGNCRYSDVTIFSFHPVKIITTAEGGIALTNDAGIAERMNLLRSHGITREPQLMAGGSDGPWYYEQLELGYNYRMTEVQAALGLSQIERLDDYVTRRHKLARRYDDLLEDLPLTLPWQHPDGYSGLHLYIVRLNLGEIRKTHREVFSSLREQGIGVNLHYIPIYRQPYYEKLGLRREDFPHAEAYYREAISLPMYPTLTEEEQDRVVKALHEAAS
ncbi:UDP-4-amino-4,6-dideoxy-N-acetyl-beta-L-altrosamine transaminase [Pelagerythrobacter rhizovicinus]|uniref:UDP-4-amino-4, 6-dideoxy-N-acetyl-beta-L-altrosamine transaminase n=1 Tax=Pelagerythrobacter rhizovicinus TaxID=2268576 RepID=A0A4Q2KNG2_9SPHN|nr:UDP-4-amino-4,6-dideoxy-N-acetyl-beta-L-altrosamine transaminase [Pelagerythrobacter rhizovicinus]RXZ64751.1 UDP-4-amino-4,6-dideoxy-N-acetyl-beta-L-altrosamine transaminase [Pelagerythrobacter rhizovicinus]